MTNPFQERKPHIGDNALLRTPQKEAYAALSAYAGTNNDRDDREVGLVLPVGCGKSGCIAIAPFAFGAKRVLVIAPSVPIAQQLAGDFELANADMFYRKCEVLDGQPYPEPVEIRGTTVNRGDLEEAQVVITNIQQLQGENNRWLRNLPEDFFDLILFDEGHHNVAASWTTLKQKFPSAKIVNFSATPLRADGQLMAGRILYSYPIFRAIEEGYVKRLKAVVLNPRTLRYVRRDGGQEIEVGLEEVRRLGEQDADFRRSIVTSVESLNTIVDASIRELEERRKVTGDNRLKIIASALNYEHCHQIVQAYRARNLRAEFVHSREEQPANLRVMQRLENHELDVIVQVRKLGEGFDHPYLTVAAVFSIFGNLSPFVQFVGRIMRVIIQNDPVHPLNQGVVVFHAGANVASRWDDFRTFSEADQQYFEQLLPIEGIDPANWSSEESKRELEPSPRDSAAGVEVRGQGPILMQEIPLVPDSPKLIEVLQQAKDAGLPVEAIFEIYKELEPIPTSRVKQRQAMRAKLATDALNQAAKVLKQRGVNLEGRELDRQYLNRTNLIVMKTAIDREINASIGQSQGQRHEFSREELDQIEGNFEEIVAKAVEAVFGAAS